MKSEWKRVRIADVADVRRGASPRPIHNFLSDEGMPWVKIADATSKNSRYIAKTKEFIKESGVSASVVVVPETLILSNSATPGLPRIMKIQACVHDGWLVFGNYRNVERDFLYYLLTYVRPNLIGLANGSVFQNLKTDIVNQFEISLPPLSYQRKVAAILSSLDDKIENNNAICKNLEETARSLFNQWLQAQQSSLEFEELRDVAEINYATYSSHESWSCVNYLDTGSITNGVIDSFQHFELMSESLPSRARRKAHKGDVLFSMVRPNQKHFGILYDEPKNLLVSTGFAVVSCKKDYICNAFMYIALTQPNFLAQMQQIGEQSVSAYPTIKPADVATCQIPVAFNNEYLKLQKNIKDIFLRIGHARKENNCLAQLRDTLLPKLMSGKIDVDKVAI